MKRALAWSLWRRFVRAGSPAPHGRCMPGPSGARTGRSGAGEPSALHIRLHPPCTARGHARIGGSSLTHVSMAWQPSLHCCCCLGCQARLPTMRQRTNGSPRRWAAAMRARRSRTTARASSGIKRASGSPSTSAGLATRSTLLVRRVFNWTRRNNIG